MVHEEEREPLLPTQEPSASANGAGEPNGVRNGSPSKVARAKHWVAKNTVVVVAATIVGVALIVFGVLVLKARNRPSPAALCLTPACVHAAASILDSLSTKEGIDPCSNFEEFVCGGWKEQHDLRADQRELHEMSLIDERSYMILRHVLESEYAETSSHSSFSPATLTSRDVNVDKENFLKLRDAYMACMNEDLIAKRGLEPLLKYVQGLKETYSVGTSEELEISKKPTDPTASITDAIAYLQQIGIAGFVDFGIQADDKDPDTQVLSVEGPRRIGLRSKEEYKDEEVVKKYTETIDAMFRIIAKEDSSLSAYAALAEPVVDLEKKLSAISMDEEDANDPLHYYNPRTLEELQALSPVIDFKELIARFSPGYTPDRVIVTSPDYIEKVNGIIKETSRDVVQAYFVWKLVYALFSKVDQAAVEPIVKFKDMMQGTKAQPERWRTCVRTIDSELGWILGRFFIEKAFSEEAKVFGDRIIYDIKEQFSETLTKLDWFDKEAAELAIQKVHNIVQKIGYPDKSPNITSPESLREYYSDVVISPTEFFENSMAVTTSFTLKAWRKLGKPTDRFEWDMTPPTVNAYYNPPGNEIVFPAGIMQFPIFSLNVPEYISYGAFASVAGHELSHAFDSTGRHYDVNGNLTDWWPEQTVQEFENRAQCFVEQYSEYSIEAPNGEKIHVNGKLTLGENIADAGGVNAAFKAWKKRDAQQPNPVLPGMEGRLTKEQLFFVSYGRTWCSKIRKEAAVDRIRTDPHSPAFVRVLGTTANAPAFLEAFNCPVKKPRCELW